MPSLSKVGSEMLDGALPALDASSLTSIPAGNLTGTVADARISALTASKLSGALPAISGASLTNLDARDLENALPAISGASLTGLPIQMEEDYWSFDMSSANGTTVHTLTASFTPELAWMTYNTNGVMIGMATGWMNDGGGTAGSQNASNDYAGKYWQGNGYIQCACTGGAQYIDMTSTGAGTYTITNVKGGSSLSGTGYFSLILFGN